MKDLDRPPKVQLHNCFNEKPPSNFCGLSVEASMWIVLCLTFFLATSCPISGGFFPLRQLLFRSVHKEYVDILKALLYMHTTTTIKYISAPCSNFPLPAAYQEHLITSHLYTKLCLQVLIISSSNLIGGGRFTSTVNSLIPRHSMKHLMLHCIHCFMQP